MTSMLVIWEGLPLEAECDEPCDLVEFTGENACYDGSYLALIVNAENNLICRAAAFWSIMH